MFLLDRCQCLADCLVDECLGNCLVDIACAFGDPAQLDLVFLLEGLFVGEVEAALGEEYILATWKRAYSQLSLEKSTFSNWAFATCLPFPAVQHEYPK